MSLSLIANFASIAGFIISLWVLWDLNRIKSQYLFSARVPALARKLRKHSSTLSDLLNDAVANATLIAEELAAADATISSLVGKLTGATKKSAKALGKGLREARASGADVVKLREVYLAMIQLREELKNLELDLEWER